MHCGSLQSHRHRHGSLAGSAPQFLHRRRYSVSLHQHSSNTVTRLYYLLQEQTLSSSVASYGACAPPRLPTISFLVHFGATIQILRSLRDQLMQMSTAHSSFDQYYISHKTISHRAAAAPSPKVRRECPMT